MERRIVSAQLSQISTLQYSFATAQFNSQFDREKFLVLTFEGVYGYGSKGNGDARFMKAVVHLGCEAFDPSGIVLDFRHLDYQWGDEMAFPIGAANVHWVSPAILISDLCREGMTSFVEMEMGSRPEDWLFDDLDRAIQKVEQNYNLAHSAEEYIFPRSNDPHLLEQFESQLHNKSFREIVASKYRSYSPLHLPFHFMSALMIADAREAGITKYGAEVFSLLAQDFLARFELKALDVFLEGLLYGTAPDKIYWLERLAIPLLDLFLQDIERRIEMNTTISVDILRKAHNLFSTAKKERLKVFSQDLDTLS